MHISFNRDPEEGAAKRFVFSHIAQPAPSGGERVAGEHAFQRARRRKLPIGFRVKSGRCAGSFLWVAVKRTHGGAFVSDHALRAWYQGSQNELSQR